MGKYAIVRYVILRIVASWDREEGLSLIAKTAENLKTLDQYRSQQFRF
jgi:hypothetical protein